MILPPLRGVGVHHQGVHVLVAAGAGNVDLGAVPGEDLLEEVAREHLEVLSLILTLRMDDLSQQGFDRLREEHFPRARNFIPVHLALFHKLPGDREREVSQALRDLCLQQGPFSLTSTGLISMGRSVGYRLESPTLQSVRRRLADEWWPWLGAQDRSGFRPHVTVQNKVEPEEARSLHRSLEETFAPFEVGAEGLVLWRYLGGAWEPVGSYDFGG